MVLDGASSSYSGDFRPEKAINGQGSFWHSAGGDDNPWIAVRMPYNEVVHVDVADRSDNRSLDRYQKVEVRISSSNISSFDTAKSCGVQSHPGGTKHKYR